MVELTLQILEKSIFSWTTEHALARKKQVTDVLTILDMKNGGLSVLAKKFPIIIGTYSHITDSANLMIHYAHKRVSNRHAIIYDEENTIKIIDCGTKTGTIIERDKKLIQVSPKGAELQNKDIIILGTEVKILALIS